MKNIFYQTKAFLLLTLLIVFISQNSIAQKMNSEIIVHMTDSQLGFSNDDDFKLESENFERVIKATNVLKPKAVFITGDLINRIKDPTQIKEYKRIVGLLDSSIPFYAMPGNHDLPDNLTDQDLAFYRKNFGKDYDAIRLGATYALVLNSQMIASGKNVEKEYEKQYQWLNKTLKKAKKRGFSNILVFQHHPYFIESIDEKDEYFNIPTKLRKSYLDLFQDNDVRYIFTGHLHYNVLNQYKDIELITTGPISKAFHGQKEGVRIVKIDDGKLTHQFYSLQEYENKAAPDNK